MFRDQNWFQNRRAKLKQDAKKQQGSLNLYHGNQSTSDSETSPGFVDTASQYHTMMGHWSTEQRAPNGLGISHAQSGQHDISSQAQYHALSTPSPAFGAYGGAAHLNADMFSSQEELNRRTLTQEQFDAMERNGGMMNGYGAFEDFASSFNGDHATMDTVFPGFGDFKQQHAMNHYPIGAPMTSYDSTIPSNVSAESLPIFPSSTQMQTYANISAASSEWSESRSSSIHEAAASHVPVQHQPASTSQWQPGQSVPVDATQQQEEFRQVAARASQTRPSPQHSYSEDTFARRGSSASLVQSMGDIGIQTPPQAQGGTFKSPAPPSNIAARRQRAPRPAALGVAALRSQSHSGLVPQASPVQTQQQQQFNPVDHPLRRIRSSNQIGNIGRVMKSTPGSAQRSPLNYTFADAMNSPHAMRHASSNLAPPTPLSPKESTEMTDAGQLQQWQSVFGSANRQVSITETEAEHAQSYQAVAPLSAQMWTTSPPHTPMYHQHQFVQSRINGHPIVENTPPQSAPASQTCFQSNAFAIPHAPAHAQPVQTQTVPVPQVPSQPLVPQQIAVASAHQAQQAHFMNSDAKFQVPNVAFAPVQTAGMPVVSTPQQEMAFHFSHGVPIADANGNIDFIFPSTTPAMPAHFIAQTPQTQGHTPPQQYQHMHTPPQVTYPFVASTGSSPSSQGTGPLKAQAELFVHEYSPPDAVKRAATPRKGPIDTVPRNYAFANTGPEHFEEKKGKKSDGSSKDSSSASSSTSPASSSGTAMTSTF